MKKRSLIAIFTPLVILSASCDRNKAVRPNIIYILADDLGYGETGVYGQQIIKTPNIDALAADGILFTNHYSGSAVSAPSRCVLLTGYHTGHAQVRGNDEWSERGPVWDYKAMIADSTLEGQRPLAPGTVTISSLLQNSGYTTAMFGKWGLGAPHTESIPTRLGFDYFVGYNCQRIAHTYYPVHLYKNENRYYLDNDTIAPNTRLPANSDPYNTESFSSYTLSEYAPDVMFREMTGFIETNSKTPFFIYWATPIPHVPLQAPVEWVDKYVAIMGDEEPYLGEKGYFPHRNPHAAYAAMVSYLDFQIGQLISLLKEKGLYENTLIIFTSDNGPSYAGGTDSPWFNSGAPFRNEQGYIKGSLNEGGIRVPMIASWPGKIRPGSVSDHISSFQDVLPTLCEVAGIAPPSGKDGISFLPELRGKKQNEHEYLYWEFPESGGQQAVRIGNNKAIRKNMHKGNLAFELYDISIDPRETNDIAEEFPDIIAKALVICAEEHVPSENPLWRFSTLNE
ncbi:MAG: arylsulfatase [Bacteroidales bacterium]|nr:arylsulfatase [Bacteroidales bacterium]